MKQKYSLLILLPVFAGAFYGCNDDSLCNCMESTGGDVTEYRSLPEFNSIELNQNVDLILKSGSTNEAKVTAGKNLIDGIKTRVENNVLHIENINRCNWLRDFKNKFTIELTYQQLEHLTYRGSGVLTCADTIKSNYFFAESWNGTGTLNFLLDCQEAHLILHTGPADINAAGRAAIMYVYSVANGYVRAADVAGNYVYVTTRSTGDCYVSASVVLGATIRYQGDVYYKKDPASIWSEISGSGKLIGF